MKNNNIVAIVPVLFAKKEEEELLQNIRYIHVGFVHHKAYENIFHKTYIFSPQKYARFLTFVYANGNLSFGEDNFHFNV